MQLKALIEDGGLDESFDVPILSYRGKDTFNSLLQKIFAKTNIPLSSSMKLSAHSTRHFALSEVNRISSEMPGFTANRLQNLRMQIGHTSGSNQMQTNYNSYLYQASTSLVGLLSTDQETQTFSFTPPASLKRRLKMKIDPGKKAVEYDLDNIDLFKIMFLKEFELSDYLEFIKGKERSEVCICRLVNQLAFTGMKKAYRSLILKFKQEIESRVVIRSSKRRKLLGN